MPEAILEIETHRPRPGGSSSLTWVKVSTLKDAFAMNSFRNERSKMVLISVESRLGNKKSLLQNLRNLFFSMTLCRCCPSVLSFGAVSDVCRCCPSLLSVGAVLPVTKADCNANIVCVNPEE